MVRMPNARTYIAALEMVADFAKRGFDAVAARGALTRRHIDHGSRFPSRMPPRAPNVCAAAEGPPFREVIHRAGVHGDSSRC